MTTSTPTIPNTLPTCTTEMARKFFKEADTIVKSSGTYGLLQSATVGALAEYIAYQAGYIIRR